MSTYGDIKLAILQRIFATTGNTLVSNNSTSPYLNVMPRVINSGLNELSTLKKYKIKSHDITQDGEDTGLVQKYDFKSLVSDFYEFGNNKVYLNDGDEYKETLDYKIEADKYFVLPSESEGTWTVYYNSYPAQITSATSDDAVMDIDPEIEELLILYACSRLYLDDDSGYCTLWLNMYDDGFNKLKSNAVPSGVVISHTFESW